MYVALCFFSREKEKGGDKLNIMFHRILYGGGCSHFREYHSYLS